MQKVLKALSQKEHNSLLWKYNNIFYWMQLQHNGNDFFKQLLLGI